MNLTPDQIGQLLKPVNPSRVRKREQWKAVAGQEGRYAVSNLGRVRSMDRVITDSLGHTRTRKGVLLKPVPASTGYLVVSIGDAGEHSARAVHRLVAEAFHPNPCDLPQVRHLDGDRRNNTAANLAWGSASENNHDKVRHGTHHEAAKSQCANGHAFTEQNTRVNPRGDRACRACDAFRMRQYRARKRAAIARTKEKTP